MISQNIVNIIVPILKRRQVVRASVFGSFATGTNKPDSDLDLRIEFPEGKSYFDLIELEFELEAALGRKVDLVTYNTKLHPIVLEGIVKEKISLF